MLIPTQVGESVLHLDTPIQVGEFIMDTLATIITIAIIIIIHTTDIRTTDTHTITAITTTHIIHTIVHIRVIIIIVIRTIILTDIMDMDTGVTEAQIALTQQEEVILQGRQRLRE
jgi:hypothetical protein